MGSCTSYSARITNLTNGTGATGGNKLDGSTVDDGVVNTLSNTANSDSGQCWFIARSRDTVNQKRPNDTVTVL